MCSNKVIYNVALSLLTASLTLSQTKLFHILSSYALNDVQIYFGIMQIVCSTLLSVLFTQTSMSVHPLPAWTAGHVWMKWTSSPVSVPEAGLGTPVRALCQHVGITLDTLAIVALLKSNISSQMMWKRPGLWSWFFLTKDQKYHLQPWGYIAGNFNIIAITPFLCEAKVTVWGSSGFARCDKVVH